MRQTDSLGALEQVILLAVARLGDDAYGMSIRREIEMRGGRRISIGAVYATLERLADKGHVRAHSGAPSPERDGRARRFFTLTRRGTDALEATRALQRAMWAGLELGRDRGRS